MVAFAGVLLVVGSGVVGGSLHRVWFGDVLLGGLQSFAGEFRL